MANIKMIVAEDESIKSDIPKAGNTNTPCCFGKNIAGLVEEWCEVDIHIT